MFGTELAHPELSSLQVFKLKMLSACNATAPAQSFPSTISVMKTMIPRRSCGVRRGAAAAKVLPSLASDLRAANTPVGAQLYLL